MLQLLKFDANGKKSLLGNLEIGKGSFLHLEMVVAYDTVKWWDLLAWDTFLQYFA